MIYLKIISKMRVNPAKKEYKTCTLKTAKITSNSPTNPDVPGNPELAIAKSIKKDAKIGIVLTTPPYLLISFVCNLS